MDYIQSIRAFVTVVRLESFTKAARQLNLSIASLSRAVSSLESHTQTRLVNRTSRHVLLAPGARDYFDVCVDVLNRLHEGEQRLLSDRVEAKGVLRIAAHPMAIEAGLAQVISEYQGNAPEVGLSVSTHTTPLRLDDDGYDVAVYPPELILDAEAVCRRLICTPIALVASNTYLQRNHGNISQGDLSGHIIVSCQGDTDTDKAIRIEMNGKVAELKPESVRMNIGESMAIRLALSGFGLALLPELLVAQHLADEQLRLVFPGGRLIRKPAALGVAYVRQQTIPRRTRNFVDACVLFFGSQGNANSRASVGLAA
ncbi:LysR family transcriptional regulator [Trinickia mobilis]|uniref:LysR family transcriptional regulator n=1 Tax=Trinickia mobilis TaxID=2816356 RepID=UPI001A8FF2E9|nr:LysR family transcriptional regulator [Trinickia mobilis]